ncbi:MAG: carbohydrate-binding family 9-like protein [Spirochaetales bacterium]|nr:carbohydrate-binding family 9-like protein [Spirochaetales bacterium]
MPDTQKLVIPEVEADLSLLESDPEGFSELFDQLGRPASIGNAPWKEFPDKPEVSFRTAWSGNLMFLKYTVKEREILGSFARDFSDVYKDSCVELFLSPEEKDYYYNLEFNCIGSCLMQKGPGRENREVFSQDIADRIIRIPSLGREPIHRFHEGLAAEAASWSLMLVIPASVFTYETIDSFKGVRMKGNLYKCGDELETPHYLCWNRIETEQPDFHRPDFFGELWFS